MNLLTRAQFSARPAAEGFALRSDTAATVVPRASIVIVTRNRLLDVQQAVRSALTLASDLAADLVRFRELHEAGSA